MSGVTEVKIIAAVCFKVGLLSWVSQVQKVMLDAALILNHYPSSLCATP
jgi:hypothetical protein